MPLVTFLAVLFTSGLDVGLLMFPMVDFEIFASEPEYVFANPLALEFGFWGFLVWGFYFLTTFYFCVVEPRLQLFEVPAIKLSQQPHYHWHLRLYRLPIFALPAKLHRRYSRSCALCLGGRNGADRSDL